MKSVINKFKEIERELSKENGKFYLFALFLREDSNKWDLLAAAEWIDDDKYESLSIIADKVKSKLQKKDVINLSRIVLIDNDNPEIETLQNAANVQQGCVEIRNCSFFGLDIKQAFVITSRSKTAIAS